MDESNLIALFSFLFILGLTPRRVMMAPSLMQKTISLDGEGLKLGFLVD